MWVQRGRASHADQPSDPGMAARGKMMRLDMDLLRDLLLRLEALPIRSARVLREKLPQLWDEVQARVACYLPQRRLKPSDEAQALETPKMPMLIAGGIDRGPSDGRAVYVVPAGNGYTWEIRRYGSLRVAHGGDAVYDEATDAWRAGLIALDVYRLDHSTAQP